MGPGGAAPGTAAFYDGSRDWQIQITSMSCATPGNCSAGGYFEDEQRRIARPLVLSLVDDAWGRARLVPGLAAISAPRNAEIVSVSCATPGNCAAGGYVRDNAGDRAFVVSQVNGSWGPAAEVPGAAALATGGGARVQAVSCASPGNCAAAGVYAQNGVYQAFVVNQVDGTWGRAQPVPGLARLNRGGVAGITSVSCPSTGTCAALGNYAPRPERNFSLYGAAFAVREVDGIWGTARAIPAPGRTGYAVANAASCAPGGGCAAGGFYVPGRALRDGPDTGQTAPGQAYVVISAPGSWGAAQPVAGVAALGATAGAEVTRVSCPSVGSCTAAGKYYRRGMFHAFVLNQVNGTWQHAAPVPGLARLAKGRPSAITALSCASAGNCAASGYVQDSSGSQPAFVVSQAHGTWGAAQLIPGFYTGFTAISCAPAGRCSAA